jgi:hypothetical protein
MARDSGDSRQLAQAQTWTLLASQIIPPRKHSPCPRARMQDPTGPGPGTRTGPGRTPGRTAAAAHHPRHRTGSILGDFTRKLQTNVLTWRPGLGPGWPILTLGQPASGLETGQHRSTSRRHQAWNGPASQLLPVSTTGRTRHPVSASCHTARKRTQKQSHGPRLETCRFSLFWESHPRQTTPTTFLDHLARATTLLKLHRYRSPTHLQIFSYDFDELYPRRHSPVIPIALLHREQHSHLRLY